MLINDTILVSMSEEVANKYIKMQDVLLDDEPCVDIVRVIYDLEHAVKEFKKRIIIQHINYCHSGECEDPDLHIALIDDVKTILDYLE
ncbi:hypothetical protein ACLKUG_004854 [Salmonella enterica subsp. enterica serovar Havana]|uniref:Uncharacterized protein n=1 Tax=Salmonella enterica TaxID=28901 RepID=A0A723AJR5_SALER|nr:hypothetical protein [Salmonella enterica subsp. enterica serovar Havana]HAD9412155.1 hypothetical protein [Salmonella enterica]HAZ2978988.1 hypothetical protein [Salmonella enterica subsp. enterica serovar Havana]